MQRLYRLKQCAPACYCARNVFPVFLPTLGDRQGNRCSSILRNCPGLCRKVPTFKIFCLEDTWTSVVRCYSTTQAAIGDSGKQGRLGNSYTSIEPEKEEEFVFLDYSNLEEENDDGVSFKPPSQMGSVANKERNASRKSCTEVYHRALEIQMRLLEDTVLDQDQDVQEMDIEFHDAGFPLPKLTSKRKKSQKIYGTPDKEIPFSDNSCSGCGARMHCTDPILPGYVPSEKYKQLIKEDKMDRAVCQRCFLLVHHQKSLNIQVSKEEYRNVVSRIRQEKALVLFIVDLLDIPDSIIPDLLELVGKNKTIVVLGNKIDLLPGDSDCYLKRIKRQLFAYCVDAGITLGDGTKDVHLISAKTGYGIENLISSLQRSWKYKGDVYLVGTANAGKSTLFNTLLESDYCKSKAPDVIQKATISRWPGTTLNLLKFPIINPTPYRMFKRSERLKSDGSQSEKDLSPQELRRLQQLSKQGYLVGRVGRSFGSAVQAQKDMDVVDFDLESLSVGEEEEDRMSKKSALSNPVEFTHNELKDAHWLYDTPGIMKEHCVLSQLTDEELKMVVPTQAILPRTFVLKPGMVLFLGALVRIDFLKGERSCWLSIVASNLLPVHITSGEKADDIYQKHAGNTLLGVPAGGEERMRQFPALVPQDFELQGVGPEEAIADIKLSSVGWVAVTAHAEDKLLFRVHSPAGAGLALRRPPLLPHIVLLKGKRIRKSPTYKAKRPPTLLDTCLSTARADKSKK
uniref:Nitric oxide associated 1 n=1 Tax=Lepisosteus oculatus TaxID=7918 RepID=W5N0A3_LEPOC|nr:PREDICTED: nitric oxide-associated protein 1 [Lepisosteus oculatus]